MKQQRLTHKFVETIPEQLNSSCIYISIPYTTAVHLCCCGCGLEVVTPLSPTDWELSFNGESVSFSPSIGNWSFSCRSHYWIKNNKVKWAGSMSSKQIMDVRNRDRIAKEKKYGKGIEPNDLNTTRPKQKTPNTIEKTSVFGSFIKMIKSLFK